MKKLLNKKGFTLIELLAVIVILAIVAAVTMAVIVPKLTQAPLDAAESSVGNMKQQLVNACSTIGSSVDMYGTFDGTVSGGGDVSTCQSGTCTITFSKAQLTAMKISGELPETTVINFNQCAITSGTFTYSTSEGQFKGITVTLDANGKATATK